MVKWPFFIAQIQLVGKCRNRIKHSTYTYLFSRSDPGNRRGKGDHKNQRGESGSDFWVAFGCDTLRAEAHPILYFLTRSI